MTNEIKQEMKEIVAKNTDGKDFKFKGYLIASTPIFNKKETYFLYKTARKWVGQKYKDQLGDNWISKKLSSKQEIKDFFTSEKFDYLAKELFEKAGLDFSEEVE